MRQQLINFVDDRNYIDISKYVSVRMCMHIPYMYLSDEKYNHNLFK